MSSTVLLILAIIKFIVSELPKFLESFEKYKKDEAYNTASAKIKKALEDFTKKKSLEALKLLEESQK